MNITSKKLEHIIVYLIFKVITIFIRILPFKGKYYFAVFFGRLAYFLNRKNRKIAKKNLDKAFPGQLDSKEKDILIKKTYNNLAMSLVEILILPHINESNFNNYLKTEGKHYLDNAYLEGNGVILFTAHFGNWEWLGAFISLMGFPVNAVVKRQKNIYIDNFINSLRESKDIAIIEKGIAVRQSYKCLRRGEVLLLLGDQAAGSKGWLTKFFGIETTNYSGAVRFAEKTGAKILPVYLIREGFASHKLLFYPPHTVEKGSSKKEQKQKLQRLIFITEEIICQHKSQWLWLYNRWKKKDGK